MRRLTRLLIYLALMALILGGLYLTVGFFFTDLLVDLWWFRALGYEAYFWQRLTYRQVIFGTITGLFFLVFFVNFWVASRFLGATPPPAAGPEAEKQRFRDLLRHFRRGSVRVYLPFSLLLGVLVAYPLYHEWEAALLFLFGPHSGVKDPAFGLDISYYFFSLPLYRLLLMELFLALGLLFLGLALLYRLEKRPLAKVGQVLPRGARVHLNFVLLAIAGLGVKALLIERQQLLYSEAHTPLFYGPGFVEMWLTAPLIWLSLALLVLTAAFFTAHYQTRRGFKGLLVTFLALALALTARHTQTVPDLVQRYLVKPDEISREKTFMQWNIQATLAAYGLDKVETREFPLKEGPLEDREHPEVESLRRNIPVWDREVLLNVYQQLQELRTYYHFFAVDVDRYKVRNSYQQVFLAARELNLKDLPAASQNWVNQWLKYTHGYGAVMTPAAQGGDEPMIWFLEGIPPRSGFGFSVAEPAIYFGLASYNPAIAPNDSREVGVPTVEGHTLTDYQGKDGVPVNTLFKKLIFALYFKERDIFFTTKTNTRSKMLFRRNIKERIGAITPFLLLDKDPYVVVTDKGLYWIQDAYTTSDRYPCVKAYGGGFNYVRNSVKIVVDAYHGSVDYYVADARDPIIRAYRAVYPSLFKDLDRMPSELKAHLRYPKELFDLQMAVYARYHQADPEIFYKQEDLWEFPTVSRDQTTVPLKSYYLTLNLMDPKKPEFLLLCPMVPKARGNLRALAVAGCDGERYGRLTVFNFPKGTLVYGPSQVNAIIDQDTVVSQQFTLWNQLGSQVERGRLLVLPVVGGIYYIQPVYLKAAAGLNIPQLKRLIVNKGELVVMEPSLEQGFTKLTQRLKEDFDRARRRLEGLKPKADQPPGPAPASAPPAPAPAPAATLPASPPK